MSDARKRFTKEYERDFSLTLEEPWAQGLSAHSKKHFDATTVPSPFVVFYVTGENLQIWEHRAAFDWYMDKLLEKNVKGPEFMQSVIAEYAHCLAPVQKRWAAGPTADIGALRSYVEENRKAIELLSLWYYTATNERTPEDVRQLAIDVRNHDDYFASNSLFIKGCVELLGGRRDLANLIFADEFPTIPDEETLRQRARGVVSLDGLEHHVMTLEAFANANPDYEFEGLREVPVIADEVQGQSAYRGQTRGVVRVIRNEQQARGTQAGDILVAPMTTPDFLPAMKLAAAFVTDEGGITCHAAIVARELKKPCVIGTKIATKVFKDGDMVEVDAEKGIVTKLPT